MTIGWFEVATVTAVPAVLVVLAPRRWLLATVLLWLASPLIAYCGLVAREVLTRPATEGALWNAFYGFMLVSPLVLPAWLLSCLTGFALGFGLRKILRPTRGAARRPALREAGSPASSGSPASRAAAHHGAAAAGDAAAAVGSVANLPRSPEMPSGWRYLHVGFDHDGLTIGGVEVWKQSWRQIGEQALRLPHPSYPAQLHRYEIFEAGPAGDPVRFAAGELSNSVWGFYLPVDRPVISRGVSADGSLRYEHRLRHAEAEPLVAVTVYAVLADTATGQVLFDGATWASSGIKPNADGTLFLHLRQNGREVLFQVDPVGRTFCDRGEGGVRRPLLELAAAAEEAQRGTEERLAEPHYRRISPDGTLRVDLASVERANTHWVNSPRVVGIASGRTVLDLWGTDWDADVSFPAEGRVRLDLRHYRARTFLMVELDLVRETYQILFEPGRNGALPEAPLREVAAGLEAAARRTAAIPAETGGSAWPVSGVANPWAAWRSALVILACASAAIGTATFLSWQAGSRGTPPPTMPAVLEQPSHPKR